MTIDLHKDAADVRAMLDQRTKQFLANFRGQKVSGIQLGYSYYQGWVVAFFDRRPVHECDGEWTVFDQRDLLHRPHWQAASEALQGGMTVTYLLPDGGRRDVSRGLPEHEFAGLYGQMLADTLVSAEVQGVFDDLDKTSHYKLDVEEFDGAWAWET